VSDATRRDETRFALVVTALYAAVVALLSARHEPWTDELNLWLIARDAPGWAGFQKILDHGGHGRLWHTLQWVLARATGSFTAAQALQCAIATSAVWIQARHAPFPRLARALLPLGIFPLFEYGVIARPYGLATALWFTACALWPAARSRPLWPCSATRPSMACSQRWACWPPRARPGGLPAAGRPPGAVGRRLRCCWSAWAWRGST